MQRPLYRREIEQLQTAVLPPANPAADPTAPEVALSVDHRIEAAARAVIQTVSGVTTAQAASHQVPSQARGVRIRERLDAMDIARAERGVVIAEMQEDAVQLEERVSVIEQRFNTLLAGLPKLLTDALAVYDQTVVQPMLTALIGGMLPENLNTMAELVAYIQADQTGTAALLAAQQDSTARLASLEPRVSSVEQLATSARNTATTAIANAALAQSTATAASTTATSVRTDFNALQATVNTHLGNGLIHRVQQTKQIPLPAMPLNANPGPLLVAWDVPFADAAYSIAMTVVGGELLKDLTIGSITKNGCTITYKNASLANVAAGAVVIHLTATHN